MCSLRWSMAVIIAAAACCHGPGTTQAGGANKVELKVVKYEGLADLVRAHKGKVILLDFWATTCIPCKQSFPYTVEMHKKFADKGLVVISVSTDDIHDSDNPDPRPKALKFLQDNHATFTNVLLDEPTEVLKTKLRINNIPCIYVFNREGQWTQFIGKDLKVDGNHRPYQVEEYVKQLLAEPAAK